MPLTNKRTQFAVGQGLFHAGELSEGVAGGLRLRYVVDCGAMASYAEQRDARVDAYLKTVGAKKALDLLFISHAHADHLNGVERLLDKSTGLAVKTIVMPLLNVEDRLIAYAHAAFHDAASAATEFYRDFVSDPAAALGRRFRPDQLIFVRPGNRGTGGPFSDGPDGPRNTPDQGARLIEPDQRLPWKLIGTGALDRPQMQTAVEEGRGNVTVMPDTLGFVCPSATLTNQWLFAPFVDPTVTASSVSFMTALALALGKTVAALKKWLRSSSNLQKLLTVHVKELKYAYTALGADLNITSMCLYTGPVPVVNGPPNQYSAVFGTWRLSSPGKSGIAWLGTGDAALAVKKRRDAFLKHYGKLLDEVVTLTLPHHGSEGNFDVALLESIRPSLCVVGADQYGKWRHPGTAVVQAVASSGHFLSVVTASNKSEVVETAVAG